MKKAGAGKGKQAKAPKNAAGHVLAPAMPEGTLLTDLHKKQWKLGKSVGSGGFGLIYLTSPASSGPVPDNAEYCLKIEPHENGPLFCELHFYMRAAQANAVNEYMKSRSMKHLGIPRYVASGNHERDGKMYRFMVMQRFGTDLQKLFEKNGKRFPTHTVFQVGLKLIDVLEYLHEKEYVHADIKASNLLTGYKDPQEVYLIDYGLAFRYMVDGKQKEYKEDPRKAHDGTVEFTSRDAHLGVLPNRRADLEILGYCLLQWLCGTLPWENNLANKNYVRDEKIKYMKNIPSLISACFQDKSACPKELQQYLEMVAGLKYDERPNYTKCRQMFSDAIKRLGHKENEPLNFNLSSPKSSATQAKAKPGDKRKLTSPVQSPVKGRKASKPQTYYESEEDDDYNIENDIERQNHAKPRAGGSKPKPAEKRKLASPAGQVAKGRQASKASRSVDDDDDDDDDDDENESEAENNHLPPVPKKQVKREWPKAKVSAQSSVKMSDTSSPIAIAKAKKNKVENGSTVSSPRSSAVHSPSPLHIIRAKNQQAAEANGVVTNGRVGTPNKGKAADKKTVVKHKKHVQTATSSTQVTPGLKENGRSKSRLQ